MPHIPLRAGPSGLMVSLWVRPSVSSLSALGSPESTPTDPVRAEFLVEIGARHTLVDPRICASLNLTAIGETMIQPPLEAGALQPALEYEVCLQLSRTEHAGAQFFDSIRVAALDLDLEGVDGVLGRDLLSSCLFVYGEGKSFQLAF